MVGLTTGQEVAAHIATLIPGIEALTPEQLLGDDFGSLS
jgi:hypothetical protein